MQTTSDLYFAAYLHASGHRLDHLKPVSPRKKLFCFVIEEELWRDLWGKYVRGGTVEALAYANAIRNFKTIVAEQ